MKKLFLFAVILCLSAFLLVACNDTPTPTTPESTTEIPLCTEHAFGDWQTTKEATCLEEGVEEKLCTVCGFSEERSIEKLPEHTYGKWKTERDSSFTEKGIEKMTCSSCGDAQTREIDIYTRGTGAAAIKADNDKYDKGTPQIYRTQGGCYTGKNYYQAIISKNEETAVILKKNVETGEIIYSEPRPMEHANDITYNPKTNQIIVTGSGEKLYIYDADTLEYIKTVNLGYTISAISYNEHDDTYVTLSWENNYYFDADFKYIKTNKMRKREKTSQGMCSDENYIYNLYCESIGGGKYKTFVIIHDHNSNLINEVTVSITGNWEPENISIVDGELYIMACTPRPTATLFRVIR